MRIHANPRQLKQNQILYDMKTEIILACINLLALAYLIFFKKYFEKKGENLATKEDIQEITRLTESAKAEYMESFEVFKKEIEYRYKFQEVTKDYKVEIFKKTVEARKFLMKWSNNMLTGNITEETVLLLQEITFDLSSNQLLHKQYSGNTIKLQEETNKLITKIHLALKGEKFDFDATNLQECLMNFQNELLE